MCVSKLQTHGSTCDSTTHSVLYPDGSLHKPCHILISLIKISDGRRALSNGSFDCSACLSYPAHELSPRRIFGRDVRMVLFPFRLSLGLCRDLRSREGAIPRRRQSPTVPKYTFAPPVHGSDWGRHRFHQSARATKQAFQKKKGRLGLCCSQAMRRFTHLKDYTLFVSIGLPEAVIRDAYCRCKYS